MSQPQHIFVVDDEAAARDMVGDYLKMQGFQMMLCDGGATLRGAAERARPDLVVLDADGNGHPLTASEFCLLKAFAENPKRVPTRERLLDLAQARDSEAFDRAIDVRITRIRRKIEPDPARPRVMRTVRGAGYVFSPAAGES